MVLFGTDVDLKDTALLIVPLAPASDETIFGRTFGKVRTNETKKQEKETHRKPPLKGLKEHVELSVVAS